MQAADIDFARMLTFSPEKGMVTLGDRVLVAEETS
jgi:hypothetical protein